jgi:hypothetical protein
MIRKRRHTRRNYQVLRENESPQGVNCIFYRSAERLTRLCGAGAPFRPLFLTPFRRSLFRGTEDFPNHHGVQRPSDNRGSIGESTGLVNSIPSKKEIRAVGIFLAPRAVRCEGVAPESCWLLRVLSSRPPPRVNRLDFVRGERLETGKGFAPWLNPSTQQITNGL